MSWMKSDLSERTRHWWKMAKVTSILYLFAVAIVGQAITPSTFLTTVDQGRLLTVFKSAEPYTDVANAHYSILGMKLLGTTVPNAQEACKKVTSLVDNNDVASLYHASAAANAIGNCKISPAGAQDLLTGAIKETAAVADIFYAFFALKNMGLKVDNNQVSKSLTEALKKDDSPSSYGYAFLVSAELPSNTKMFDSIEDVIAQADEVDEKYLQFEGGLYVTSLVINGAYKLSESVKKAPTLSNDKVIKFANYFLSRKHVHQLRAACQFVAVIKTLTENKYHIPVAVTLARPVAVSIASPVVQVRVTNLLGKALGDLTVTADNARHIGDDAVVLSKKPFTASKSDNSLYELDFMKTNPARGFYKIAISVTPKKADSRLIGTSGAEVNIKVTTQVAIENVEVGVADKDQTMAARTTKLQHPSKAANVFQADNHQKMVMRFQLKDKSSGKALTAHQTFVKLTNQKSKQEIIFVADSAAGDAYKFDLDVGNSAGDFGHQSGKYSMELIVGDAVIENPFSWYLADVELTFPEGSGKKKAASSLYASKPEIKHMFREPEKRPPEVVSLAFTALCLLPLVVLLLLWLKLGINMNNFTFSPSTIGFHFCLGVIFCLYYCYWAHLNMFDTLRYLGIVAVPTFIFGNRLLSRIAAKRKGVK